MHLLIVEDSEKIQFHLSEGLRRLGYTVESARDGEMGLWHARSGRFDLIVLDLMLPKIDGLHLLAQLRSEGNASRVLILTARDRVPEKVQGLRAGADDYMVKPFSFEELVARIEALARRTPETFRPIMEVGNLCINPSARTVSRDGKSIDLTAREYQLLEILAKGAGRVFTRQELESAICDQNADLSSNLIDVYIHALRRKLDVPGVPSVIRTRRGFGYSIATGGEPCRSADA